MLQHQPSRTAEYMAMFRASEHAKGAGRRVFTDPLAVALLPEACGYPARLLAVRPVGDVLTRYIDRQWPGARTSGIARTRLIDDWIGESIGQAEQVVLLGAGFDTRAWRLAALNSVKVFEVDHPATAKVKRRATAGRRRRSEPGDLCRPSISRSMISNSVCAMPASIRRGGRSSCGKASANI